MVFQEFGEVFPGLFRLIELFFGVRFGIVPEPERMTQLVINTQFGSGVARFRHRP